MAAVLTFFGLKSVSALEDRPELLDEALVRELVGDDAELAEAALDEQLRDAAAFRDNPVDVNTAAPEHLMRVPSLAPDAVLRVLAERETNGPFLSLDDLVVRGCLSRTELEAVRPYIVAEAVAPRSASGDLAALASQLTWSVRVRAATSESRDASWLAAGAAGAVGTFARARASYGEHVSVGVSCEKDAGERSFLDHAVGYVIWGSREASWGGTGRAGSRVAATTPDGRTDITVGIGDFVGSWGQGLVMRSGGFPSAGAYPRTTDSVRGYDGAGEATSRRGLFLALERGRGAAHLLLARTGLDAAVGDEGAVTSIRESGYHRTPGEEDGAGVLKESLEGVRLRLGSPSTAVVGISLLRASFSPELAPGDSERQHFRFSGESSVVGGADVVLDRDGFRLACEVARTSSGGTGVLAAGRFRCGGATVAAGTASLSRDYWSPVGGGAPGVSGGTNGASAWVVLSYRPRGSHRVWMEARLARRPWRSYHLELPDASVSTAFGCEISAGAAGRGAVEFRTKQRTDEKGAPAGTVERITSRLKLSFRTRGGMPTILSVVRAGSVVGGAEEGSLLAVGARITGEPLGCSCDAGVTSVTRWGSLPSHVGYEPSLPGEFALRSLNASGLRWYIRARRNLTPGFDVAARMGGGPGRSSTEFAIGIDARS